MFFLHCFKDDFKTTIHMFSDPRQIYVPVQATTAMLIGSSRFRSKARLPVLTYLHPNKASICRCSQPLSGFSARCLEDEQMLEAIRRTNPNSNYMYVVDTRPRVRSVLCVKGMHLNGHSVADKRYGKSCRWQRLWKRGVLREHQIPVFGHRKYSCDANQPAEACWK